MSIGNVERVSQKIFFPTCAKMRAAKISLLLEFNQSDLIRTKNMTLEIRIKLVFLIEVNNMMQTFKTVASTASCIPFCFTRLQVPEEILST